MARICKPPAPLDLAAQEQSVFLAGSIENGQAEDWQARAEQALADLPITILNPRRTAWDATWNQSCDDPDFQRQVQWELAAQEQASLIVMYFSPTTQAPITLLELGLFARSGKVVVCCPAGYWRRGNVEIVCAKYGIPLVPDFPQLLHVARERLIAQTSGQATG